jgi:hypothetical protein
VARFQGLVAERGEHDAIEEGMHHATATPVGKGDESLMGDVDGTA